MSKFLKSLNIHSSWEELLTKDNIKLLDEIEEKIGNNYYPATKNVLRFLEQDLNKIKCIIVGMDPYPSCYTDKNNNILPIATGRSFEVANLTSWQDKFKQSSLRNILKTLYSH